MSQNGPARPRYAAPVSDRKLWRYSSLARLWSWCLIVVAVLLLPFSIALQAGSAAGLSGTRNPLDRVKGLLDSTGETDVVQWLCEQAGGFFVRDPDPSGARVDAEYIAHTQRIIEDFSNLLRVVSEAIADDGRVDRKESQKIRTEWQRLKQYAEGFVHACERGLFAGTSSAGLN